jgi:DNA-binding LacI/PurR family transcriptional regulator
MEDIAQRLNISRATVSYVINGRTDEAVSAATRLRVLAAAEELGFRPNRAAQVLAGQRSRQIELLTRQVHPAFYSEAIQEFQRVVADRGYELRVMAAPEWTKSGWDGAGVWPADGIVAFDDTMSPSALRKLQERRVPMVSAGGTFSSEVDHVGVDLIAATQEAVRVLRRQGRRTIAHVNGAEYAESTRWKAYREAVSAEGLEPSAIVAPTGDGGDLRASFWKAVGEALRGPAKPDALICYNDEIAIAALAAVRAVGLKCPEDVAIVGCDGIEETLYHEPALSTIIFPFAEVASLAWGYLRARIEEPTLPVQSAMLTARLELRGST